MKYTIDFQKTYNEGEMFLETTIYIVVRTRTPFCIECRHVANNRCCWTCGARTTGDIDSSISIDEICEDLFDINAWYKGETKYWKNR